MHRLKHSYGYHGDDGILHGMHSTSQEFPLFEIGDVIHDELNSLWSTTNEYSGITEDYYLEYFKGKESGYAICVKKAELYDEPICIKETFGINPPQSFAYVHKS